MFSSEPYKAIENNVGVLIQSIDIQTMTFNCFSMLLLISLQPFTNFENVKNIYEIKNPFSYALQNLKQIDSCINAIHCNSGKCY